MTFSARDLLHLVGILAITGGAGAEWGLSVGAFAGGIALVTTTLLAR